MYLSLRINQSLQVQVSWLPSSIVTCMQITCVLINLQNTESLFSLYQDAFKDSISV